MGNDHRTDCILSGCRQLFKAIPKCGTKSALFPASQKALFKNRFPRHEQQFKSGSAHICTDRLNNSLTYYGALSPYGREIPLAACGIVMKTNAILLAVIIGISQGSQPIIGFNYGAKQYDRVRGVYKLAIQCNLVISLVGFLLFQLCPRQIISLFGTGDALYFEFAVKFMRIFLFMVLLNGVQLLSSNFFAAIGKPVKGMLLSLTRQVFFLIPCFSFFRCFWESTELCMRDR